MSTDHWEDATNGRHGFPTGAPALRVVSDPDREVAVRDRLLREAIKLATSVQHAETRHQPVLPTGLARGLLSAATAYLDVMRPNGDTT